MTNPDNAERSQMAHKHDEKYDMQLICWFALNNSSVWRPLIHSFTQCAEPES